MFPGKMQEEFHEIFHAESPERGTISARSYALGCMVEARRTELHTLLMLDTISVSSANAHRITILTGELTLLLIARGA